jgi:hypothetical protein
MKPLAPLLVVYSSFLAAIVLVTDSQPASAIEPVGLSRRFLSAARNAVRASRYFNENNTVSDELKRDLERLKEKTYVPLSTYHPRDEVDLEYLHRIDQHIEDYLAYLKQEHGAEIWQAEVYRLRQAMSCAKQGITSRRHQFDPRSAILLQPCSVSPVLDTSSRGRTRMHSTADFLIFWPTIVSY